jgi:DNA (cytosine-5)-methyltransferase 1
MMFLTANPVKFQRHHIRAKMGAVKRIKEQPACERRNFFDYVSQYFDPPVASAKYPNTWDNFTFIDLFVGIGGIRLGFESVGGKCVFSSEWDKAAAKTYEANFGEKPRGDITKIKSAEIPDFDILLAGFPCQPFSIIGNKAGFEHETQGTLFFEIERVLSNKKPSAFMLENVRNLTAHDGGRTFKVIINHLEALGYTVYYKVLNALDFGVPNKRERIIICGFSECVYFEFPKPIPRDKRKTLSDILEPEEYVSKKLWV